MIFVRWIEGCDDEVNVVEEKEDDYWEGCVDRWVLIMMFVVEVEVYYICSNKIVDDGKWI